jgi:hypothetical protein
VIEPAVPEIKKNISKDHNRIDDVKVYDRVQTIEDLMKDACRISDKNDNKKNDALPL